MNDEQVEAELRSAVRSHAESVQPCDRLDAIRARTRGGSASGARTWTRPWVLVAGSALAAASLVVGAVLLINPDETTAEAPVADSGQREVTVYEVGEVGDKPWLYPVQVTTQDTGDDALDALRALLDHEPTRASRSNMLAECPLGGDVNSVTTPATVVTVDLSAFPPGAVLCDAPASFYEARDQQLAWTVRTVIGEPRPVRISVEGGRTYGSGRADPNALSPVLLGAPVDGDDVTSPVTVTGTSDTFEANVVWEVLRDDGDVVDQGVTMGGTLGERGPFRFSVDLPPGEYTVRAYETSAEDGSVVAEDTKAFSVAP